MPLSDTGRAGKSSHTSGPDALDPPRDAAHWFSRMHSGEATDLDRQAFAAWRSADPAHERQYRELSAQWDAMLSVSHTRLRGLMQASMADSRPPPMSRRRFAAGMAAACSLPVVAGILAAPYVFDHDEKVINFATRKGERRQVALPDGSTLHLNGDTRLVARFGAGERRVELAQGEAFFDVHHDASRPFLVLGGVGQVTVTGTRFNVRRDSETLQVSVESGSVRLESGPWWRQSERRLTAGQQAIAYGGDTLSEVTQVNIQNLVAWQRGKIIFNNIPLATVISEMNRYLPRPARLEAPELGQHRISGVFSVDDPLAMIDALPAIAPVSVDRLPDGGIRVTAR
ncbi:FecR family protein [Achromobacter sp. Bel]|uniref:FecR family protein n=1 Tax=Achromobacter sp. Bel TaxID=2727415 RepID=UPI00145E3278|nr:FecR family protein [Achromobacter sp. Bel]NMK48511.1 FecR family protein [Achromobacter sp. Bel]